MERGTPCLPWGGRLLLGGTEAHGKHWKPGMAGPGGAGRARGVPGPGLSRFSSKIIQNPL